MVWKKFIGFLKNKDKLISENEMRSLLRFDEGAIATIMLRGGNVKHLFKKDEYSEQTQELAGVSFSINADEAESVVANLQSELSELGYLVFICEAGDKQTSIGILKGKDPFDILKVQQTNGDNYDISNEDVIAKLRDWNHRYPFTIIGADSDWVEAIFHKLPYKGELRSFAREIYEFCPDAVDQGTESIDGLIEEIQESRKLKLWWD